LKLLLATLCSAVLVSSAWSAPIATLTFRTPNATVLDTDTIDVWLTLSFSIDSEALVTDGSGYVTPLPSLADIAANLFSGLPPGVDENSATSAIVNVAFGCGGNFTSSCTDGPPYTFAFNYLAPSFIGAQNLNMQPGTEQDFLYGTFTPDGGRAPAGTYTFPYAAFFIQVYADDPDFPGSLLHIADIPIADTCGGQDCDNGRQSPFTRDVLATSVGTPEPATYSFILAGLAMVVGMKRARSAR